MINYPVTISILHYLTMIRNNFIDLSCDHLFIVL
ncbi:Uncharacterised protein [Escherichia coli]|nr:Uncharacterised protein [Escherichia coli]SQT28577.1 Uncharacterised protein [Escherichia coli]